MMKIGNREISDQTPCYIIAEIGVNHNGSMDLAKKSIDAAYESGADAVKFQTFKSEKLVSVFAKKADYQTKNTNQSGGQLEMLKALELSIADFRELKLYCEDKGIEFLSTPFDEESAVALNEMGVHAIKIGSGDLTNIPFLRFINTLNLPVILSTGMGNLGEVEEALSVLNESDLFLLHCTSNYPTPFEDVNLNVIKTMREAFRCIVGYSDHTLGNEAAIGAVTLGAKILEKHFTLDRSLPGPDHKASMNPTEFKEFVKSIRNIELSLGDGVKRCMPSELSTKNVARKSLVANTAIKKGELFTTDNLTIKRPGDGIEPKFYDLLLGKTAKNDLVSDQTITWEDVL